MHFYNDALLTAALAEGIAGESSVLGEMAADMGELIMDCRGLLFPAQSDIYEQAWRQPQLWSPTPPPPCRRPPTP